MRDPAEDGFSAMAYGAVLVAYVALGLVLRSVVLNWVVGPLFLLATFHVLPNAGRALRRRGRGTRS